MYREKTQSGLLCDHFLTQGGKMRQINKHSLVIFINQIPLFK